MTKVVALFLCVCLVLSGCGFFANRMMEPVTFYYLEKEFQYGNNPSLIVSEEREASGHRNDLSYLLALYLMGPAEEEHRSPLLPGTRVLKAEQNNGIITLELVNPAYAYSDLELSLACACLTLTCLDITDASQVNITYQDRTIVMTKDSITLFDDSSTEEMITEES